MTQVILEKYSALTEEERQEFEYHSFQIEAGIKKGQEARNQVVTHILNVISRNPPLWREKYSSEEEYIKTELNIEVSSFWRLVKANKNYLFLLDNAKDQEEQITLSRMRESAYRELRQIATDNKSLLKRKGETDEEFQLKLQEKESIDNQLVQDLWNNIYPKIKKFKLESNTGLYPQGGFAISARDITETSAVLQNILNIPKQIEQGIPLENISVGSFNGEEISFSEVIESTDNTAEVIDYISSLEVSEHLNEKLKRQNQHIRDSLEKKYEYDRFDGILIYEDGRLKIENESGKYDLLENWGDLLGKETSVSIRRLIRTI